MKKTLLLILPFLFLISCEKGKVYEKHKDINDYVWKRDQMVSFNPTIDDVSKPFNIFLEIRHLSLFPYTDFEVNITIKDPDGNERTRDFVIPLRDKDNKYLAKGMGDFWDLEYLAFEGISFSKNGEFTIEVLNQMPVVETVGLMELGLKIVNAEEPKLQEEEEIIHH